MAEDESLLKAVIVIAAAILLLPILGMTLAMAMMGYRMGGGVYPGYGGMGLIGLVPGLAVVAIGGVVLYYLLRAGEDRSDEALEELRRGYARGELDKEEYLEKREVLERG